MESDALSFLVNKLDAVNACRFAVTLITDVIHTVADNCPGTCIEICDRCISTFSRVKEHLQEKYEEDFPSEIALPQPEELKRLLSLIRTALRAGCNVHVDTNGKVDVSTLPPDMSDAEKQELVEGIQKMAPLVMQMKNCGSEDELASLMDLMHTDTSIRN